MSEIINNYWYESNIIEGLRKANEWHIGTNLGDKSVREYVYSLMSRVRTKEELVEFLLSNNWCVREAAENRLKELESI